jgi:hypothetical protein
MECGKVLKSLCVATIVITQEHGGVDTALVCGRSVPLQRSPIATLVWVNLKGSLLQTLLTLICQL